MPLSVPIPPGHIGTIGIYLKDYSLPSTGESIIKVHEVAATSPLRESVKAGYILRKFKVNDNLSYSGINFDASTFSRLLAKHSTNPDRRLIFEIPLASSLHNQASQKDFGDFFSFGRKRRDTEGLWVTLCSNDDEEFSVNHEAARACSGYVRKRKGNRFFFLLASSDILKLVVEFFNNYKKGDVKWISEETLESFRGKKKHEKNAYYRDIFRDSVWYQNFIDLDESTIQNLYMVADEYEIPVLAIITELKMEKEGWKHWSNEFTWKGPYPSSKFTKDEWKYHYLSDIRTRKANKTRNEIAKEELDKQIALRHKDKRYKAVDRHLRSGTKSKRKTIEKHKKEAEKIGKMHRDGLVTDLELTDNAYTEDEVMVYETTNTRTKETSYFTKSELKKAEWAYKFVHRPKSLPTDRMIKLVTEKESKIYENGTNPFVKNAIIEDKLKRVWMQWNALRPDDQREQRNKLAIRIINTPNMKITSEGYQALGLFLEMYPTGETVQPRSKSAKPR